MDGTAYVVVVLDVSWRVAHTQMTENHMGKKWSDTSMQQSISSPLVLVVAPLIGRLVHSVELSAVELGILEWKWLG